MAGTNDPLMTLTAAKRYLAEKHGLSVSRATLKRWAKRGVRGVRLNHRVIGDWYYTRRTWVDDFVLAKDAPAELDSSGGYSPVDLIASRDARNQLLKRGLIGEQKAELLPRVRTAREGSRAVHAGLQGGALRNRTGQDAGS
jgi:hypothetical protein